MPKKSLNENRRTPVSARPEREQRHELLILLRREQEGKSVPGYAEYIQRMEELDRLMDSYYERDTWGVTRSLDSDGKTRITNAVIAAAEAGEQYLKNVGAAATEGKKLSLSRGTPGLVNRMQGLLSMDMQTLRLYDPELKLSLPQLLESSRTKTLILGEKEFETLGGAQNSRIPLTIERPDGKKYRGLFTRVTHASAGDSIRIAMDNAASGTTEDGKEELNTMMSKIRKFAKEKYPGIANYDDTKLFLRVTGMYISEGTGRSTRKMFSWKSFCEDIGLDLSKIGEVVMRELGRDIVRLRGHTNEMINSLDLGVQDGARIDSRSSAMSAVAELLGTPQLLARSINMRFTDGKGQIKDGSIMDFSNGLDLNEKLEVFDQVNDTPFAGKDSYKLLRQAADLQVLDYICGNVDRHGGNMMYITNEEGTVVGLQGIDNDSSFGNFANGKKGSTVCRAHRT